MLDEIGVAGGDTSAGTAGVACAVADPLEPEVGGTTGGLPALLATAGVLAWPLDAEDPVVPPP